MSDDKRFLDHIGVTAWHAAGWTGSRGLSATGEPFEGYDDSDHGRKVYDVHRLIAPDRKVVHLTVTTNYVGGKCQHKLLTDALPQIIAKGVDTLFASLNDTVCNVPDLDAGLAQIADKCCLFFAAGNDSGKTASRIIQCKYVWGVGAYYLMANTKEMRPAPFSSVSDGVEFCAPTLINGFSGTSCSTPVLAGMAALVNDMAIAKTGRPLSQAGMHRFLQDCAVDIGDAGRDSKTGIGAPILPPPDKVDIAKYQDAAPFKDDSAIPDFAREGVEYCRAKGYMRGDLDGKFRPNEPITRAEFAVALMRYDKMNG
ncbi:S-layer homology domain-containing protein [Butyricicoccus sp. Marseille-Q5471]|uniref:S-layer homology domain-containing protein n=1 Tax=Butyricicoccus sp. Marseille-Q5471 TaxID=3039493 RepID=UPI0024BD1720|nr:S-layer homology domain-containing protein [Butyricicoccus sp. Marseille-Q5471]